MDLYERDKIPLPKNYLPLHPFNNGEQFVRDELLAAFPRTQEDVRKHLHDYYAVISAMDHHIGRLFAALKELGMYDNTIFIYSADHGLAIGSHGLFGKQNLYEAGMKPPLVFAGPGIPQGETQALVYLLDIFPTVCDLVGTEIPSRPRRQELEAGHRGQIVRRSRHAVSRLSRCAAGRSRQPLQVDSLSAESTSRSSSICKTDPDEITNLADQPQQAAAHPNADRRDAERWQQSLGDTTPLVVDRPQDPRWESVAAPGPPPVRRKRRRSKPKLVAGLAGRVDAALRHDSRPRMARQS